jgi:hypothetical protein
MIAATIAIAAFGLILAICIATDDGEPPDWIE